MKFCVVTDVKNEDFEIIKKHFSSKTVYFTDSSIISKKFNENGLQCQEIQKYFGDINPRIFSIYDQSIKSLATIEQNLETLKFCQISIIQGLKSYFLERLILLQKIKSVLENHTEIVFLFSNLRYFQFCIPNIAYSLGHNDNLGVAKVKNQKLEPLNFEKLFCTKSKYFQSEVIKKESKSDWSLSHKNSIGELITSKPVCGFFLINNDEDFYLKPVYPILEKLNDEKISNLIFTFTVKTQKQLESKGFEATNLSSYCDLVQNEMLMNENLIQEFFNRLINIKTTDVVLSAYLKFVKNDRIIYDLARVLSTVVIVNEILENSNFKSLVIQADGASENDIVCSIAKEYNIHTYSFPPIRTGIVPTYRVLYNAEKLLVSGNRLKRELSEVGIGENRLIVTGSPIFDYIKNSKNSSQYLCSDNENVVLVAMNRIRGMEEKWFPDIVRYCNEKGLKIIMKLHPLYKFGPYFKISQEKIKKINEKCHGLNYKILYDMNIQNYLPKIKVLITESSSVGIYASLHEKPIITVNITKEEDYDYSLRFEKEGIAMFAKNSNELIQCLDKILNDKNVNKQLEEARKKFNYEYNYLNDGKAAERIIALLSNPD